MSLGYWKLNLNFINHDKEMYYICIACSGLGIVCLSVLQDHHADAALPGMEEAHL